MVKVERRRDLGSRLVALPGNESSISSLLASPMALIFRLLTTPLLGANSSVSSGPIECRNCFLTPAGLPAVVSSTRTVACSRKQRTGLSSTQFLAQTFQALSPISKTTYIPRLSQVLIVFCDNSRQLIKIIFAIAGRHGAGKHDIVLQRWKKTKRSI